MNLEGAVIAVVGVDETTCEPLCAALREAGAVAKSAIVNASALATLSAGGFDVAVLHVGDEPERFVALSTAMSSEARTRGMPVFALVSPDVPCRSLAGLGSVHVVPAGGLARLVQAVADVVTQRRATLGAVDYARGLEDQLRIALGRLSALRSDAQTLTHDTRVLCGVVVGLAANLRDGITGPLETAQRGHVARILAAANDTAAIIERFGGAARAHTELPNESLASQARRTARRTLLDLADLAKVTMDLFGTVAQQKAIATAFEAPEPVSLWGDAMQIRQVVTNLLVNALKFTPSGGRVHVAVRSAAPGRPASGTAGRHHAQLVVSDTGPGIPPEQRERVFERGARLARDERVPGSGIGLAVVREIVAMHGGSVEIGEAPGGGAALTVTLPLDMRSRREPSVLLVEDAEIARRIVDLVRTRRHWTSEAVRGDEVTIASALERCRAVVIVPRGDSAALDELLGSSGVPGA